MDPIYNYNLGNCGMYFEGAVNREYLTFFKKAIKIDSDQPEGCQSEPVYRIVWECKSDADAVAHGFHEGYWDHLNELGATLIRVYATDWGIHPIVFEFVTGILTEKVDFIDSIGRVKNEEMRGDFIGACLSKEKELKADIAQSSWNKGRVAMLKKICTCIDNMKKRFSYSKKVQDSL